MRARALISLCLAGVGAWGSSARADDAVRRILLDRELNTREVMLVGIDDDWVTWHDGAGRERRAPTSDLVAIIAPGGGLLPSPVRDQIARSVNFPVIETTDGQRLTARLRPDEDSSPDHVELMLVGGSTLRVRVEQIDRVSMPRVDLPPPVPAAGEALDDVVVLANGDTLHGFVAQLGPIITIEIGGEPRQLPLDQIARIDLANPPEPKSGARAQLDDGSVLACESISTKGGVVTLRLSLGASEGADPDSEASAATELRLPISRIAGVLFDQGSGGAGVRTLSASAPTSFAPTGTRRWTPTPEIDDTDAGVLGDGRIILPGPMRARWPLPDGASRLAGVLTLGDRPGPWADCEVVLRMINADGSATELSRSHLNAADPEAPFNLDLGWGGKNRSIEFAVEEGAYGPVQDRVILERVLMLVE